LGIGLRENFPFQVIFILSELESVQLFQQTLASNFSLTDVSTSFGPITFDTTQQRSFTYSFIGRLCNGSWTILKTINSTFTNLDTNLNTCINYPNGDIIVTEDIGKLILINTHKTLFVFF
jgi:hypothetical protein